MSEISKAALCAVSELINGCHLMPAKSDEAARIVQDVIDAAVEAALREQARLYEQTPESEAVMP